MRGEILVLPSEERYVLKLGRLNEEMGIGTLIDISKTLSNISFIFA